MRKTSLQQIIKDNQSKLNKLVATGLLGTMLASFASCDQFLPTKPAETNVFGNIINGESAEIVTDKNGNELTTEGENSNKNAIYDQRSQLFIDARNKWAEDWNRGYETNYNEGSYNFQTKGVPFRFLEQEGVVYYDEDGNRVAYGNEDFLNNDCICPTGFIDPNSEENDFYILMQYHNENNGDVVTWLLKYTLGDQEYRDLLLLAGDYRARFLIQEIDQHYTPEIINKTVVSSSLLDYLGLTDDWDDSHFRRGGQRAYISHYDCDNLTLTIDYGVDVAGKEPNGNIYSYTYYLKDSPDWDRLLQGSALNGPMSKEERDALTNKDLIKVKDSAHGEKLMRFGVLFYWSMRPSDEQKAKSTLKYDFEQLTIESSGAEIDFDNYMNGYIPYEAVNNLTKQYALQHEKEYHNGK